MTGATAQFAALEPIWAGITSSRQLRTLLVFGALFNAKVHVHDTQIIDNPRVIDDYSRDPIYAHNLYRLLKDLIEAGVVVVGLRESNYLLHGDRLETCGSLSDVLRSWESNDPAGSGWVTSPLSSARRQMIERFDATMSGGDGRILRYDLGMKQDFVQQVRADANRIGSKLATLLAGQPIELRRAYDRLIEKPWFSHMAIFALLRDAGLPLQHELIQIHGIFDEAAYAHAFNARLLGSDWQTGPGAVPGGLAASVLSGADPGVEPGDPGDPGGGEILLAASSSGAGFAGRAELIESAYQVIDSPAPELLSGLRIDEILALRERAAELFEIQTLLSLPSPRANPNDALTRALADAAAEYWDAICDHIRRTRPHLSRRPNKLAIFLRRTMPTVARFAERFAVSGLTAIAEVALNATPVLGSQLSATTKQKVLARAHLEFVFFTEGELMRDLRAYYPYRGWIAPDARALPERTS